MSQSETPREPGSTPAAPEPAPGVTGDSKHEPAARPWELELLISGAVVFSLLQLPGAVDRVYDRADPHLAGTAARVAFFLYYPVKLILYTLIACFMVHLVSRAYWVGLIGLESVFPNGIRWDQSNYGPVMSDVYRRRLGGLQRQIDGTDRFSSVLFSFAFTIVMVMLVSFPVGAVFAAAGIAISQAFFEGRHAGRIIWTMVGVVLSVPILVWLVDRRWGERVRPESAAERWLRRGAVASYYTNAMPVYGTVMMVLFSNVSRKKMYTIFYAVFFGLVAFFIVKDVLVRRGVLQVDSYRYVPQEAGALEVGYRFYESQRPEGELFRNTPSIQSDVVRDPYVKLFIPYSPRRHNESLAALCPGLKPLETGGLRLERPGRTPPEADSRAVLECWKRLQPVRLDGRPLDVDFGFYTHPRSGLRGIIGYIPVAGLAPGMHTLVVEQAAYADDTPQVREERKRNPYTIRFWL